MVVGYRTVLASVLYSRVQYGTVALLPVVLYSRRVLRVQYSCTSTLRHVLKYDCTTARSTRHFRRGLQLRQPTRPELEN